MASYIPRFRCHCDQYQLGSHHRCAIQPNSYEQAQHQNKARSITGLHAQSITRNGTKMSQWQANTFADQLRIQMSQRPPPVNENETREPKIVFYNGFWEQNAADAALQWVKRDGELVWKCYEVIIASEPGYVHLTH